MRSIAAPSSFRTLRACVTAFCASSIASLTIAEPPSSVPLQAGPEPILFTIERGTAAPDGRSRPVMTINGTVPGPIIHAKENETIRVKVVNKMDVPTTVHWHGMHQIGTNDMDGVPGITGPAIPPGGEFLYQFKAQPAGTHWYHSHEAEQEANGVFGALIIDEAKSIAQVNRDQVLLFNDWFILPGDKIMANLRAGTYMDAMGKMPMQGGMGDGMKDMPGMREQQGMGGMDTGGKKMGGDKKEDFGDVPFESGLINGKGRFDPASGPELEKVEVRRGEVIRLRVINASTTYALRFQVDGHPLTVIASDGMPLKPIEVDNLWVGSGERYDVLLKADGSGSQWIRGVTGDGNEIRGVLHYAGSPDTMPEMTPVAWGPRMLTLPQMHALRPEKFPTDGVKEMYIHAGGSMRPYMWSINGQVYPKADPIVLSNNEEIRMIFTNTTGMSHPFHLHGHSFRVLGKPGELNLVDPPLKDTVMVPAHEDLVIQWTASNRGNWFFHCHIAWHMAAGMTRVVQIQK